MNELFLSFNRVGLALGYKACLRITTRLLPLGYKRLGLPLGYKACAE